MAIALGCISLFNTVISKT